MATASQPLAPQNLQPVVPEAPARAPRFPREDPVFNGWEVLLLFLVLFALIVFVSIAGVSVAMIVHVQRGGELAGYSRDLARNVALSVILQSVAYALALVVLEAYLRSRHRMSTWRAVGWAWPRPSLIGALAVFGGSLALFIAGAEHFVNIPKNLPIEHMFQDPHAIYLVVIFAVLIAPPVEETFFRGLLYPVLNRRVGLVAAILLTGFAFALIHITNFRLTFWPLFLLFVVGVALTTVRALTRSLAPSIVVHMAYNGTLMFMLWLASDHFRHLERVQ